MSIDRLAGQADQVSLPAVRAAIASCFFENEPEQLRLGNITLHAHQRSAVTRIRRTVRTHGGALLCDRVGLGKTYVALAVAASYDSITVVAPAALKSMWQSALSATGLSGEFTSIESLGRSGGADCRRSFIIVDEAHHFRNSCTRRYTALAHMCTLTPVLLLTATPLHNSRDDISAIAALFLGSRAYAMTDADLATILVRRDAPDDEVRKVPYIEHATPVVLATDESTLEMLLALPAPVPPSDGEVASRLVIHGLVRQWASSNAALAGALKRRIARSHGLLAALTAGRYPTAAELAAWVYTGDAVQLAFAEWLTPAITPLTELEAALRAHVDALSNLLVLARQRDDGALAAFVRDVRFRHPGEKIVAFSCFAETAIVAYRAVRPDGHVALLTARGAMIASGPISRNDVLAQFAPQSEPRYGNAEHAEIDLLVTTDLLSEGVNLQEASIVIHLDLPWTASRLEQRTGRLARLGSRHERVVSYTVNPPPRAEAFLRELDIIARKSRLTTQLFGSQLHRVGVSELTRRSAVEQMEDIRTTIDKWRRRDSRPVATDSLCVAFAHTCERAALGAWIVDGEPTLLLWSELHGIMAAPAAGHAAVGLFDSATQRPTNESDAITLRQILTAAEAWYDQRRAWAALGEVGGSVGILGPHDTRKLLARVADAAITNTPFSRRAQATSIAGRLRRLAGSKLPLAVEWSLESLEEIFDEAAVDTILDLVEQIRPVSNTMRETGIRCVALVIGDDS